MDSGSFFALADVKSYISFILFTSTRLDRYCPAGRKKLLDGIQDQGESWSAVIDNANDWVQVGMGGECNLYSETGKLNVIPC